MTLTHKSILLKQTNASIRLCVQQILRQKRTKTHAPAAERLHSGDEIERLLADNSLLRWLAVHVDAVQEEATVR